MATSAYFNSTGQKLSNDQLPADPDLDPCCHPCPCGSNFHHKGRASNSTSYTLQQSNFNLLPRLSQAPKISSNETIVYVLPLKHICARFHKTAHSRNQQDNKNWTRGVWGGRQGDTQSPQMFVSNLGCFPPGYRALKFLEDRPPFMSPILTGRKVERGEKGETVNPSTSLQGRAMKRKISAFTYQFLPPLSWGGHLEKICWCESLTSDDGFSLFSKDHRLFSFSLQQWAPIRFGIS